MREAKVSKLFKQTAQTAIALIGVGMTIFLTPSQASSAEKVIFTYGGLTQSIPIEELQDFASRGKVSPALNTILKYSGQNPFVMRWILQQEFSANQKLISDLLNTAPGEYVLSNTGNVIGSKTKQANVTALRGALIASTSDNNLVSLIELLENYPTQDVYVNGKILARLRKNLNQFVEGTSRYINIPSR